MRQSWWIISSKSHPFRGEWLSIFRPSVRDTQLLITSLSCFRSTKSVFLFVHCEYCDKLRRPIWMFLLKVSMLTRGEAQRQYFSENTESRIFSVGHFVAMETHEALLTHTCKCCMQGVNVLRKLRNWQIT